MTEREAAAYRAGIAAAIRALPVPEQGAVEPTTEVEGWDQCHMCKGTGSVFEHAGGVADEVVQALSCPACIVSAMVTPTEVEIALDAFYRRCGGDWRRFDDEGHHRHDMRAAIVALELHRSNGQPTEDEVERAARAMIAEMSLRLAMVDEGDPTDWADLSEDDRRAAMQVARAAITAARIQP